MNLTRSLCQALLFKVRMGLVSSFEPFADPREAFLCTQALDSRRFSYAFRVALRLGLARDLLNSVGDCELRNAVRSRPEGEDAAITLPC